MTRFKIQRIEFFTFLLIFLLVHTTASDGSVRETQDLAEAKAAVKDQGGNAKSANTKNATAEVKGVQPNADTPMSPAGNKTAENITSKSSTDTGNKTAQIPKEHVGEGHPTVLNSGALVRGFYVFVGLSILVVAYIVFRSFRLSKTRAQMVRKYGVLAHRQDVEMRPLPLDEEDDEDTTVFDASNVLTNNIQHQNL
ncbi:hypothetical protein KM043_010647 [Ampulex compressa]|nr:hypothetical protein KM043_010647 [Ampulex compressa]